MNRAEVLGVHPLVEGGCAEVRRCKSACCTCRVHQNIDGSDFSFDPCSQGLRLGGIREIGSHALGLQALGDEALHGLIEPGLIACDHHHTRTGLGKPSGTGQADAFAGAGDEGNTLVESNIHGGSFVVRCRKHARDRTRYPFHPQAHGVRRERKALAQSDDAPLESVLFILANTGSANWGEGP
jgi:hypothetical protein